MMHLILTFLVYAISGFLIIAEVMACLSSGLYVSTVLSSCAAAILLFFVCITEFKNSSPRKQRWLDALITFITIFLFVIIFAGVEYWFIYLKV